MSDDNLKWLKDALEKIEGRQHEHTETLTRLTVTVEEHVRRTNLLEVELKPIKAHVQLVNAAAKVLSIAGTIALTAHSLGLL